MVNKFWVFFWGLLIGVVIGFSLSIGYTYWAVGSIAILGGIIQGAMRRQAKKIIDINPNGSKPTEPKFKFSKDIHNKYNRPR